MHSGDSMTYHNGMRFSTKDRDYDLWPKNCATEHSPGGWWYNGCHRANLNGIYGDPGYWRGLNWYTWKGNRHSMSYTAIMVKTGN